MASDENDLPQDESASFEDDLFDGPLEKGGDDEEEFVLDYEGEAAEAASQDESDWSEDFDTEMLLGETVGEASVSEAAEGGDLVSVEEDSEFLLEEDDEERIAPAAIPDDFEDILFGDETPEIVDESGMPIDVSDFSINEATFSERGGGWEGDDAWDNEALGIREVDPELAASLQDDEHEEVPEYMQASGTWEAIHDGPDEFVIVEREQDLHSGTFESVDEALVPEPVADEAAELPVAAQADEFLADSESSPSPSDFEADEEELTHVAAGGREDDDPIYGRPIDAPVAGYDPNREAEAEDRAFRQLEPIYQEAGAQQSDDRGLVVAPRRSRFRRTAMSMGMAACILILGLVGVLSLMPELPFSRRMRGFLGLRSADRPMVTVTTVPRPVVSTAVGLPGELAPQPVEPLPVEPQPVEPRPEPAELARGLEDLGNELFGPEFRRELRLLGDDIAATSAETTPVAGGDPLPVRPQPVEPQPVEPQPVEPQPVEPQPVEPQPVEPQPVEPQPVEPQPVEPQPVEPPAPRRAVQFEGNIVRGVQALAQLENGNFFVGRVRQVRPTELVLSLDRGEITFVPGDLRKVVPLAEADARILRSSPDGYVRLKNHNRLWGKILEDLPDIVTIDAGGARIVLSKESVAEVSTKTSKALSIQDGDDSWLDEGLPQPEPPQVPLPESEDEEDQGGAVRIKLDDGGKKAPEATPGSVLPTKRR